MKLSIALERAAALVSPTCPVLLRGPSGIGKTDGHAWVAEKTGKRPLAFFPITKAPEDLAIPRVFEGVDGSIGAEFFPVGLMREICRPDCPPTLLLIDDIGQTTRMQGAIMHLILARQVGDTAVSPNVSFMLCSNTREHDIYANTLTGTLIGRVLVFDIEHDYEAFARWVVRQPTDDKDRAIDPCVASYALFRRDCFATVMPDDGSQYCSPRNLARAGNVFHKLPKLRDVETIAGCIGTAHAADLLLHRQECGNLLPLKDLLDDPSLIKQESDPGLVHAYIVLAAAHAMIEPGKVRNFGKALHGELRELLENLAPAIAAAA